LFVEEKNTEKQNPYDNTSRNNIRAVQGNLPTTGLRVRLPLGGRRLPA
jgi:hypothetical protein